VVYETADGVIVESETREAVRVAVWDGERFAEREVMGREVMGAVEVRCVREAGSLREIKLGSQGVAEAPGDTDFENGAAVYELKLPDDAKAGDLVRVRFEGDVARMYSEGRLVNDCFYSGRVFDTRVPGGVRTLELRVLPLDLAGPIYLHPAIRERLGSQGSVLRVEGAELVRRRRVVL
jgi:hypothetical protein